MSDPPPEALGTASRPVIAPRAKPVVGTVLAFDEARGLGEIEADAGWTLGFHCTAITDGTRAILPGVAVAFTPRIGALGRDEAAWVRPLPAATDQVDADADADVLPTRIPPSFSATPVSPVSPVSPTVPPRPVPGAEQTPYSFRVHRDGP